MNPSSTLYILDADHHAIPADVLTWAGWFQATDRHVAVDTINGTLISTIFIGIDMQMIGSAGPPVLYETMTFPGALGVRSLCCRCSTWDEAVVQHERVCGMIRRAAAIAQPKEVR
jgi:hypothetical protein